MPPANLPEAAKKIYTAAEESAKKSTCKDSGDRKDECAARVAWSAVKNKYKKVGENWVPKADVEFSLFINKASFDKATQEMRWSAVASDTDEDSYSDNMTTELFDSFLTRIENNEQPPDQYKSEYWNGGMPYLSLAHYPDLNGKAVPGPVDSVFRDGNRLKSKGRFYNTALGRACFNSVCEDLYNEKRSDADDKVRISIAFLDYKHKHKGSNFEFTRKSLDEVCPECVKEAITRIMEGTQPKGKEYLDGHLIHEALTRVPVNKRTDITVERGMAITQKDDALSIIDDEELFEETIGKELSSIQKSGALVTKADELIGDTLGELRAAWASEYQKPGPNAVYTYLLDASESENYVIVSYGEKYYKVDYAGSDGKVKFAQRSDWKEVRKKTTWVNVLKSLMLEDGIDYDEWIAKGKHDYDDDEEEDEKDKKKKKSPSKTTKSEVLDMDEDKLREIIKSTVTEVVAEAVKTPEPKEEPVVEAPVAHALDTVLGELKATYDKAIEQKLDPTATLAALQQPMEVVGRAILGGVQEANPQAAPDANVELAKVVQELAQTVQLMRSQMAQGNNAPQMGIPQRRNISPSVVMNAEPVAPNSPTPNLQALVRRNAGLQ